MARSTFETFLEDSGCSLNGESAPTLAVEPVLFRRQLALKLRSHPEFPDILDTFFTSMQEQTEDTFQLRRCLIPATQKVEETHCNSSTNRLESLFRTLLAIDILQPRTIAYLLERLPEFCDELETDDSSSCTARLILHQLRWLDYVVEPNVLTDKLIEIIQITPSSIQHEIITSLPDIINDSEHKPIVLYLKELMNDNAALTVPILDALSNLTMHAESLEDVHETVLERLESADLDDLAVIVKFLLQTVNQHSIDRIVFGIRQKLDFYALGKVQQNESSTSTGQCNRNNPKHSPEALILESIKLGLQFHKYVCDAWVKAIVALETQSAHKVIDVLVLIILHSMTSMKKKAEQIFRKKVINGQFTSSLLQTAVLHHADGLAGYWITLLPLSESLLRSCSLHSGISSCSSALYISAFQSCDAYYRQEIVGSLVTHIGSGSVAEMDVALDVLLTLVQKNTAQMSVYGIFIKGILDYLDNLSLPQLRVLFDIFSTLALSVDHQRDGNAASLWSEIQIVIRKQLSNPRERYKIIGTIGCLSAVKILGSQKMYQESEAGSSTQDGAGTVTAAQALRHPKLKQAVNLLELVMRNCAEYPNCLSMAYDELAHIVAIGKLDERLQLWIKENMTHDFTDNYVDAVEDMGQALKGKQAIEPTLYMNLDGEEGQIVMKFLDIIYCPDEKKRKIFAVQLCSVFNLMQNCEKQLNEGSLEEIDALLGCGGMLFKLDDIDEMVRELPANEIENACDALFCAINWFRELLNAFSGALGNGVHEKLIQRLKNILELESVFQALMKIVPWFVPLELHPNIPAHMEGRDTGISLLSSARQENTRSTQVASQISDGDMAVGTRKEGVSKQSILKFETVTDLRTHMRALSLDVLCMLKKPEYDTTLHSMLSYTDINYILEDLNSKLDAKVVPPPTTFFGKKKSSQDSNKLGISNTTMLARIGAADLLKKVIMNLPHMLQTLETLYEDIQLENTQTDRTFSESEEMAKTIAHVFNILYKVFSWPELRNPDNLAILNDLIKALAVRMQVDGQNQVPDVIFKEAFHYLARFGENMPQATTAVTLFKTLVRLMELFGKEHGEELKNSALSVVIRILTTDWLDWREIKKDISFLVEQTVELCDNSLLVLNDYVNVVLPKYDREGRLEEHPLLRGDTVVSFYQALINQTVKALDVLKDTDQDAEVVLVHNATIVKIFERITNYIKMKEQRLLFSVLLRTGRLFIDQFTKHSIPYFTHVFKQHKDAIVGIFKDFQTSTRMLQIICSHVKASKDASLSVHVPPLKKALESVIYQVKMLLSANNAPSDAFFMGALKHRDIRGAEVSSQLPREESSESEQEEDQLVEDSSATSSKKQSPPTPRPSKKRKRPAAQPPNGNTFRTTSQVPSSSEEDENESKTSSDADPIEDEIADNDDEEENEDEEEVLMFNLASDEEEEITRAPAQEPYSPKPFDLFSRSEEPATLDLDRPKKRRLGVGRPNTAKRPSVHSHTGDND